MNGMGTTDAALEALRGEVIDIVLGTVFLIVGATACAIAAIGDLLERGFAGSAKALLIGALSARKATREDLAEMRKLLDDYRKGEK